MSAVWAKLEAHEINGAFPLQRCVGSTDHSGVFLTQSTPHAPSAAALKLVPVEPATAEAQLTRWQTAVELSHPHLVRIFEVGECRVDGADYLFARMELADQTLAQVLERRPLTEDEAREMLVPTLAALEYLHGENLVQGGLKPSNVLVVGNHLKLASDTVRAIGDPDAETSPASDVRALGLTLCEALTRVRPSGLDVAGEVELPPALPVSFRGIVSRCLSRDPRRRPTVAELQAWLSGGAPAVESMAPTPAPVPVPVPAPATAASPTRLVIRVELPSEEEARRAAVSERKSRGPLPWAIGIGALIALAWIGLRMVSTDSPPATPVETTSRESTPSANEPATGTAVATPPPAAPPPAAAPARVEPPPAAPTASRDASVDEVMPVVSQSALATIRGTLRVSVRLTVDENGAVVEASPDDPGPSAYFERRSLEAARKWRFPPAQSEPPRTMQIRFAFTRTGVTAAARPLP